jgi:RecJ-like exonuclease
MGYINNKADEKWKTDNPTFGMNPYYSMGFQEGYLEALKQVKNLNIPAVIKSVCLKCEGTGNVAFSKGQYVMCNDCRGTGQTVL